MKAIKILMIALVATFSVNAVSAQTKEPVKVKTEKTTVKKAHTKHHHKAKKAAVKKQCIAYIGLGENRFKLIWSGFLLIEPPIAGLPHLIPLEDSPSRT